MVRYATLDDVAEFDPGASLTVDADRHVALASQMVAEVTRFAVYTVGDDGLPSDAAVAEAMRDAVSAQVTRWARNGIDPLATTQATDRVVSGQTLSPVGSVSYDTTVEREAAAAVQASAGRLSNEAYRILNGAGLLNRRVFAV